MKFLWGDLGRLRGGRREEGKRMNRMIIEWEEW
jgi:hypothetical protein